MLARAGPALSFTIDFSSSEALLLASPGRVVDGAAAGGAGDPDRPEGCVAPDDRVFDSVTSWRNGSRTGRTRAGSMGFGSSGTFTSTAGAGVGRSGGEGAAVPPSPPNTVTRSIRPRSPPTRP